MPLSYPTRSPALDAPPGRAGDLYPAGRPRVGRARAAVHGHRRLSARDALHLAVMDRHGVGRIPSFDGGFDRFPGVAPLA